MQTSRQKSIHEPSAGKKVLGGLFIIGAAAAAAPGISDFIAGMQFNSMLHTTTIVVAGLLALSLVTAFTYGMQKDANMTAVNINLAIAAVLAGTLAACYTAGQIIAYTTPIALPHTLSGMMMIDSGTSPHALVGTDVFGTTLAFSAIAAILFAIGIKMTGLLNELPEQQPFFGFFSKVATDVSTTVPKDVEERGR